MSCSKGVNLGRKFDILQKSPICILVTSTNFILRIVAIAAGQYF